MLSISGKPMSEIRPIAACFGDSAKRNHRLILVLGREYNGSGTVSSSVGNYDFAESPKSTFWNCTYALFGRIVDLNFDLKTNITFVYS